MTRLDPIFDRRIERGAFLKMAALAGGATLLAACGGGGGDSGGSESGGGSTEPAATGGGVTSAAEGAAQEKGDIKVFEWAGYEVPDLYKPYTAAFPDPKPNFIFLTSDDQALAKTLGGFRADMAHPCAGYVQEWADSGAAQPWDTSLIANFSQLNPDLVKAGQANGEQYFIPLDWGFSSVLYRSDKWQPSGELSWDIMWDKSLEGKVAWFDDASDMLPIGGYILGAADPWNMTDEELDAVKAKFIENKSVVRTIWASQTDMEADYAAGNIYASYAWPASWVNMQKAGLQVEYGFPKEGALAFLCGLVLYDGTSNYYHSHAYADAWASAESGLWLLQNYAYGHSNTAVDLSQVDPSLVDAFKLKDPAALSEPAVHINRYIPRRADYEKIWTEIKAA